MLATGVAICPFASIVQNHISKMQMNLLKCPIANYVRWMVARDGFSIEYLVKWSCVWMSILGTHISLKSRTSCEMLKWWSFWKITSKYYPTPPTLSPQGVDKGRVVFHEISIPNPQLNCVFSPVFWKCWILSTCKRWCISC